MTRSTLAATVAAAFLLAATQAFPAGILKGKIVYRDAPVAGVTVAAFADSSHGFAGEPDCRSAPSAADGSFSLEIPAGRYFLVADRPATSGIPRLFAYYGGNPVTVGDGATLEVGVNAGGYLPPASATAPGGTGIRGRVLADGIPLAGARVTLYQDGESIYRGMGYASAMTNANGDFAFNLEPGSYFVIARKRAAAGFGPMAAGDLFAFALDNPIEVVPDRFSVVSLAAVAKVAKEKDGSAELTISGTLKGGETVIEGTVRNSAGRPVTGLWVAAYRDSMMISRPDFVARSKDDGSYSISLGGGGDYYLGARSTLGGPAEQGDLLGRYAGNEEHLVTIRQGEKLTGIDIVVVTVD